MAEPIIIIKEPGPLDEGTGKKRYQLVFQDGKGGSVNLPDFETDFDFVGSTWQGKWDAKANEVRINGQGKSGSKETEKPSST